MANRFNGTTECLISSQSIITGWQQTWTCWFYNDDDSGGNEEIMGFGDSAEVSLFRIKTGASGALQIQVRMVSGVANTHTHANTFSYGVWNSCGMTLSSVGIPTLWLNGVKSVSTDTDTPTFGTPDQFSIGCLARSATPPDGGNWDGALAEPAIYAGVELNDDEMKAFSLGYSPKFIRPNSLTEHWPLLTDALPTINSANTFDTQLDFTADHHPPIIVPVAPNSNKQRKTSVTVGIPVEVGTALALSHSKAVTIGQPSETGSAFGIVADRGHALGLANETDVALSIGHEKSVNVGLASATNSALSLTANRGIPAGQGLETDTALAMTHTKSMQVGIAGEADTALAMTITGGSAPAAPIGSYRPVMRPRRRG